MVPLVKKMAMGSVIFVLMQVWSGVADLQRELRQEKKNHTVAFTSSNEATWGVELGSLVSGKAGGWTGVPAGRQELGCGVIRTNGLVCL